MPTEKRTKAVWLGFWPGSYGDMNRPSSCEIERVDGCITYRLTLRKGLCSFSGREEGVSIDLYKEDLECARDTIDEALKEKEDAS